MGTTPYRLVEENLRVAMRCYARVSEFGEARDYPGVVVTSTGFDCAVFNSAMLNRPADELEFTRLVALAAVHFKQRGFGWTFWLCEHLIPEPVRRRIRNVFRDSGMYAIAEPPGMLAERLQPPKRTADLEIRRVDDEITRLEFAHLSSAIFTLPFETARLIYGGASLWDGPMAGWIAYAGGRAVSIVSVVVGGGVAGIYSLGTLPAYQGRGYAETIMRHALEETRRQTGVEVSILQSTSQGLNLYLRMGYRTVTRFSVYLQESCGNNRC